MYLSRIELDLSKSASRRALSSPQIIHAAVEDCFQNKFDKDRKLWRLDRLGGCLFLLLLSPERPDFAKFNLQFCSEDASGETKDYSPLLKCIQSGARFRFRLKANPVHSEPVKGGRGKVYAHVTVEQKQNWLIKKSSACGFALEEDEFNVVETDSPRFWRERGDRPLQIETAVFEGELTVTDPDLFALSLTKGIGRAKAYGCGLLTVASIR